MVRISLHVGVDIFVGQGESSGLKTSRSTCTGTQTSRRAGSLGRVLDVSCVLPLNMNFLCPSQRCVATFGSSFGKRRHISFSKALVITRNGWWRSPVSKLSSDMRILLYTLREPSSSLSAVALIVSIFSLSKPQTCWTKETTGTSWYMALPGLILKARRFCQHPSRGREPRYVLCT